MEDNRDDDSRHLEIRYWLQVRLRVYIKQIDNNRKNKKRQNIAVVDFTRVIDLTSIKSINVA